LVPESVAQSVRELGKDARAFESAQAITEYLAVEAKAGDLLLVMSNGSFDGLCEKLLMKIGSEVPSEAASR
jgi:UDP-N-acetylmuramate-alanine ligase